MITKFSILEAIEDVIDLDKDLKSMIENTLKTSDVKTLVDFVSAYKSDPEKYQINGLINSSDIYDFYMKYRIDIDKILNEEDFYSKSPDDLDVYSLYDYVVEGTKEAIRFKINSFGQTEENNNFNG